MFADFTISRAAHEKARARGSFLFISEQTHASHLFQVHGPWKAAPVAGGSASAAKAAGGKASAGKKKKKAEDSEEEVQDTEDDEEKEVIPKKKARGAKAA